MVHGRLDALRDVAHAHGATVNDVLLTAVAGGLRALLLSRGEDVHDLHPLAYEPVTLLLRRRPGGRPDDVGMIFVPLPVGVADPLERLRAVAAATADRKRHIIPAPVGLPTRTRLVRRIMMRVAARQRWAAAYVADVPGPRTRLYLEGAELQELLPVVPIAGRTPIGVGALSYAGSLGITVVADRDACPDIEIFTDGLRATLTGLAPAASITVGVPTDRARAAQPRRVRRRLRTYRATRRRRRRLTCPRRVGRILADAIATAMTTEGLRRGVTAQPDLRRSPGSGPRTPFRRRPPVRWAPNRCPAPPAR